MAGRSKKNSGKGMAVAMLGMGAVIIILVLIIGFLLIKRAVTNPLMKCEVHTADYIDETGTITGTRGYVEVNKSVLTTVNAKKFKKFSEEVVLSGDYKLFTIICGDGTGIVYGMNNNSSEIAVYGYINAMGHATETFGYIADQDGTYQYNAYFN